MKSILLSLLFFVASVAARGVRVGGGSIPADNWDAPPALKAAMAFEIIFCVGGLLELSLLVKNLRFVPTTQTKAPYLMLTILMVMFPLAYLLWAIETRLSTDGNINTLNGLGAATNLFLDFIIAFQLGVVLYLSHHRAFLLRQYQGKAVKPLQAQFWKRIFDWALCAILFLFLVTAMAVNTNENSLIIQDRLSYTGYKTYTDVRNGFSHAAVAMIVILAINIFVGLLTLWLAQRRYQFRDPIINRLLAIAFPFIAVYALESLITEIIAGVMLGYDSYALLVAEVIVEGICRLGITAAVISTMAAPGVVWFAPAAPPNPGYGQTAQYPYQPGWAQPAPPMPYPPQNPSQNPPAQNPQQPFSIPMAVSHT